MTEIQQKSKRSNKKKMYQNNMINENASLLLNKESNGTLTEDDIKKFRLLIAREPIIKK